MINEGLIEAAIVGLNVLCVQEYYALFFAIRKSGFTLIWERYPQGFVSGG